MPDSIHSCYRSKKRLKDLECLRCLCRKHKIWDLNSDLPVYLGTRYYSVEKGLLAWRSCLWPQEKGGYRDWALSCLSMLPVTLALTLGQSLGGMALTCQPVNGSAEQMSCGFS